MASLYEKRRSGQRGQQAYANAAVAGAQLNNQASDIQQATQPGYNQARRNAAISTGKMNTAQHYQIRKDMDDRAFRDREAVANRDERAQRARRDDIQFWTVQALANRSQNWREDSGEKEHGLRREKHARDGEQWSKNFNRLKGNDKTTKEQWQKGFDQRGRFHDDTKEQWQKGFDRLESNDVFNQGLQRDKFNREGKNELWDRHTWRKEHERQKAQDEALGEYRKDSLEAKRYGYDARNAYDQSENGDYRFTQLGDMGLETSSFFNEEGKISLEAEGFGGAVRHAEGTLGMDYNEAVQWALKEGHGDFILEKEKEKLDADELAAYKGRNDKDAIAKIEKRRKEIEDGKGFDHIIGQNGKGGGGGIPQADLMKIQQGVLDNPNGPNAEKARKILKDNGWDIPDTVGGPIGGGYPPVTGSSEGESPDDYVPSRTERQSDYSFDGKRATNVTRNRTKGYTFKNGKASNVNRDRTAGYRFDGKRATNISEEDEQLRGLRKGRR